MQSKWKKFVVVFMAAALLAVNMKSFADEAESRRFSVLSISGTEAFLTRGAAKEVKASAGMPVGQGNKIRTGAKTKMYLETDDSKTIRLDSSSEAEITKSSAKLLKITLKSGSLFFNVDKPLQDDEEMDFEAAQTSMSIRGTSGIISITEEVLTLYLVEGNISWDLGGQTVTASAGQVVTLISYPGQNNYQLQSIDNFTWEELSFFALESVWEQKEFLDLSAINLETLEQLEQASAKLTNLQAQEMEPSSTGNPRIIRMDVPETSTKRNRGRSAVWKKESSVSTTASAEEPTTEEPTTEEPTTEEPTTEEPTTEEPTTEEPTTEVIETSSEEESTTESETSSEEPTTEKESTEETTKETTKEESSEQTSSTSESSKDDNNNTDTGNTDTTDTNTTNTDTGISIPEPTEEPTTYMSDGLRMRRNVLIETP